MLSVVPYVTRCVRWGRCDWAAGRRVLVRRLWFLIALVQVVGDGVAAQRESDHDAVLEGGAMSRDASSVEGAIEGVVEALAVLALPVAAVVEAAAFVGFGELAQVLGAVVALLAIFGRDVESFGVKGAAGGGEIDVPAVGAFGGAAGVDLGRGKGLL